MIVDAIPELELIIGKQNPIAEVGSIASMNRFNLYFRKFIRVFTKKDHPLVIFLDDLHWADSASLNIIRFLTTDLNTKYLFIIGAYRDNEVNSSHPLIITQNEIKSENINIHQLSLAPLEKHNINQLIADALEINNIKLKQLTDYVYHKTDGNPFFVKEFLKAIYNDKLLFFDHNKGWDWDIDHINRIPMTNNVVDLLLKKINKLTLNSQITIRAASCIGSRFSLKIISMICEKSEDQALKELLVPLQEGLIIRDSESSYRFIHDKIEEAVYLSMPHEERMLLHNRIGKTLLGLYSESELEENIFSVVDQLNLSMDIITNEKDKIRLAELNLYAGEKAKKSGAFQHAPIYLRNGM